MSADIITLGCRLNIAESAAMRAELAGQPGADDLVIINSCAVTHAAERETRKAIRRARRARPDARIVVTGCAAQIDPARYAAMPEVNMVIGNREKARPGELQALAALRTDSPAIRVNDIMAVRETAPQLAAHFSEHARGFVEVQNGCDHRCTFCIIPYGRGNSRSVPAGAVIDAVQRLVDEGRQEIVLTGVDVTSYGHDLPGSPTLGMLAERVLAHVPGVRRLRLSSIDSIEIDDRLFALITQEPRMMPHVHLSLQAGSNMILKRMKRRHSREQAIAIVDRMRQLRPEIAIGADIIAGFPTEDDAMFADSLALIDACDIVYGHIFPFSPRAGTPAARMPQVDQRVIRARAAALRASCERRRAAWFRQLIGSTQTVLIERDGLSGHAENFAPVQLSAPSLPGSIICARIHGATPTHLLGDAA